MSTIELLHPYLRGISHLYISAIESQQYRPCAKLFCTVQKVVTCLWLSLAQLHFFPSFVSVFVLKKKEKKHYTINVVSFNGQNAQWLIIYYFFLVMREKISAHIPHIYFVVILLFMHKISKERNIYYKTAKLVFSCHTNYVCY